MSLFQQREWWTISPDSHEEYGSGCLVVDNIDNEPVEDGNATDRSANKIVTGSLQGILRIFYPKNQGYTIEDLMMEKDLHAPILQLEAGRFIPKSTMLALAVLHPNSIAVYRIEAADGVGKHAKYYQMSLQYEHKLQRPAHSFVYGAFGGVYDADFLCVQSMDCLLSFFDQDVRSFTCSFATKILPGPLCYVSKIDSFVTTSSEMLLECYSYQSLGTLTNSFNSHNSISARSESLKAIQVDWSVNLGDYAIAISIGRFTRALTASQFDIVVLCEHSLYAVSTSGKLRLQKSLDYNPSAFNLYAHVEYDTLVHNLIIGTHQRSLIVHHDMTLVWMAKTDHAPIAIVTSSFGNIFGLVVSLTVSGRIIIGYMGTKPAVNSIIPIEGKELDHASMEKEHRSLLRVIRTAFKGISSDVTPQLAIQVTVPTSLDSTRVDYELVPADATVDGLGNAIAITVIVSLACCTSQQVHHINLAVDSPKGLILSQQSFQINTLEPGGKPYICSIRIRVSRSIFLASRNVSIHATFMTKDNQPRTVSSAFNIPLCLIASIASPVRNAPYTITIDTNQDPVDSLKALFESTIGTKAVSTSMELLRNPNALGFRYHARNIDCTVLTSKKSGRYRLQSNEFIGLTHITSILIEQLKQYWAPSGPGHASLQGEQASVTYSGPLPLPEYLNLIDEHFQYRLRIVEFEKSLEKHAHQLRAIQKRLIAILRDKNPTPLQLYDLLFKETRDRIKSLGDDIKSASVGASNSLQGVVAATSWIAQLVECQATLDQASSDILRQYFTTLSYESDEQGWEERMGAAMTFLLRTMLAKNAREASVQQGEMIMAEDTKKIHKLIKVVCERIGKGMPLICEGYDARNSSMNPGVEETF